MPREHRPTNPMRIKAGVELSVAGDVALLTVSGLVDEHFAGFGALPQGVRSVVINVSGMTRMTSFGVRQWLNGFEVLSKSVGEIYLLGCPTFFVDQLNMVLNFGGNAHVLTVVAPYTCPSCGVESGETVDVLADCASLLKGGTPEKTCARCGGKLEFDETPESYFSFASQYAASSILPSVAQLLAAYGLYTSSAATTGERPTRIIKLVHGNVTYFRVSGTIGQMFRARPFLVGAEGEVVIDLSDVERFDSGGQREWRRMLKTLAGQVSTITLVDLDDQILKNVGDSLVLARNIAVHSVRITYVCTGCGKTSSVSETVAAGIPAYFPDGVCTVCGESTRSTITSGDLSAIQKASTHVSPQAARVIAQREELLSRAQTDANVAQAGENATAKIGASDTILGKYKILRRLSGGGMADVFLANQIGIGGFEKPVALKRIQRQLLDTRHLAVDMFLNEAKIAGRLTHPNIVQVLDVGESAGNLYLAMEYVHGLDLREIIKVLRRKRMTMPLPIACYVVRSVAQALHHAYWSTDLSGDKLAVVHRDVSPQNIIVSYDGVVKLLDFGVALSSVTEQSDRMIVGKWQYMSPEHTTNAAIDHRSDLFSLGVILYLLCTTTLPFTGTELKEVVKKIRAGAYIPLKEAATDIPDSLATLVGKMLSVDPNDRPQTGSEVADALTEVTRSYGIESSPANVAAFMSELDETEYTESGSIEIVSAPPLAATSSIGGMLNLASTARDQPQSLSALLASSEPKLRTSPLGSSSFPVAFPQGSAALPSDRVDLRFSAQRPAVPAPPTWTKLRIALLVIGLAVISVLTYLVAGAN